MREKLFTIVFVIGLFVLAWFAGKLIARDIANGVQCPQEVSGNIHEIEKGE